MHDVFVSYEHESKSIADNIVSVLEQHKIRCWYAPRDVIGDYATSIVEAINSTKVFVLVLNENSSNSRHVLNEVEMAYKMENELTIVPFKVDNKTLSMAMEYYVKRLHWIDASDRSLDVAIDELLKKIMPILGIQQQNAKQCDPEPIEGIRVENRYYTNADVRERMRLETQSRLMKEFDQPVYDEVIAGRGNQVVLDIGSNNGDFVMDRLGSSGKVGRIIGLEYDMDAVDYANHEYGSDTVGFYQCDLESPSFQSELYKIMSEVGVKAFDIVNISMIILHLKNPYKVLKVVRQVLAPGGVIIVKDIDDGLNLAYPDPEGSFERVFRICRENETSGYRHSGRQVYTLLSKMGMTDISLIKQGINTVRMDFNQRQALFDTYFSFIMEDLEIMVDRYPDSEKIMDDYKWFSEKYDDLEEEFHSNEFFFNLGFMMFVARMS